MRSHITLSPKQLGLAMLFVAIGGAAGTLIRDLALKINLYVVPRGTAIYPSPDWTHQIPWVLLAINTFGVFVATDLLRHRLKHHDPNDPTRLLLVTGFLGGLTSYSGLFVDLAAIWHLTIGGCLLVAAGAIVSGLFAGMLGLGRHRRRA
ncbi:MAG: CrcB family protein [Acidimicrobiales bacterium]|jgi:fluoride ion exporter CrcB/FEX